MYWLTCLFFTVLNSIFLSVFTSYLPRLIKQDGRILEGGTCKLRRAGMSDSFYRKSIQSKFIIRLTVSVTCVFVVLEQTPTSILGLFSLKIIETRP